VSLPILVLGCWAALGALGACSPPPESLDGGASDGAALDATAETQPPADPTRSTYTIELTTDLGQTLRLERDVTDTPGAFSFGSTHIAPATSLAVSESLSYPATVQIAINFGILADPSGNLTVQTGTAGTFPFDGDAPEIDVTWGIRYRSTVPGAQGEVVIDAWSMTRGGVMSGRFQGRLVEQSGAGAGTHWADVTGTFHLILPPPESGG